MRDLTNKAKNYNLMRLINLFVGIYNLHVYVDRGSLFPLVIGSLNIGVWVFTKRKS